jgi:hypothetical protein
MGLGVLKTKRGPAPSASCAGRADLSRRYRWRREEERRGAASQMARREYLAAGSDLQIIAITAENTPINSGFVHLYRSVRIEKIGGQCCAVRGELKIMAAADNVEQNLIGDELRETDRAPERA